MVMKLLRVPSRGTCQADMTIVEASKPHMLGAPKILLQGLEKISPGSLDKSPAFPERSVGGSGFSALRSGTGAMEVGGNASHTHHSRSLSKRASREAKHL